jgi:TPR repeat protein
MRSIAPLFILLLALGLTACGKNEPSFDDLLAKAEAGDSDSQYSLGLAHQEGRGTEKDLGQAIAWYKRAAVQGEVNALYSLGYMAHHKIGMEQDFDKAAAWYRAAGDAGHPKAMFELARFYTRGLSVERSFQEAAEWIEKAANQGMFEAQWRMGQIYTTGGTGVEGDIKKANMWYDRAEKSGDLNSDYDPDYRYTP